MRGTARPRSAAIKDSRREQCVNHRTAESRVIYSAVSYQKGNRQKWPMVQKPGIDGIDAHCSNVPNRPSGIDTENDNGIMASLWNSRESIPLSFQIHGWMPSI